MKEQLERPDDREPEEAPEVSRRIAKESGFLLFQKRIEELGGAEEVEAGDVHRGDFAALGAQAGQLYDYVFQLKQRLDRGRGSGSRDPDAASVDELTELASQASEQMTALTQFTEELEKGVTSYGAALSAIDREFRLFAVRDLSASVSELFERIAAFPVESRFSKRNVQEALRKGILQLLVVGLTSGFLGGDTKTPRGKTGDRPAAEAQAKTQAKDKKQSSEQKERVGGGGGTGAEGGSTEGKGPPGRHKPGERYKPGVEGRGKAGEFPAGAPFAEVDYAWFSDIEDPLWVTDNMGIAPGGELEALSQTRKPASEDVEARVTFFPFRAAENTAVSLPTPAGFCVGEIQVEPHVRYEFDPNLQTVTFREAADEVSVRYTVVRANEGGMSYAVSREELLRSAEARAVVDRLRQSPSYEERRRTLDEHLGSFTYVVSDDLQKLLDRMPGTIAEKTGGVKAGDCDTLSAYAACLLDEAGHYARVAVGYVERDRKLDRNRSHAKLVMEGGLYETTAATDNQFVNIVFADDDRARLEAIVGEMRNDDPKEVRLARYAQFREELGRILSQGDRYDRFRAREGVQDEWRIDARTIKRFIRNLGREAEELPTGWQAAFGIALMLMSVTGLVGTVVGAEKILRRGVGPRLERKRDELAAELFEAMRPAEGGDGGRDSGAGALAIQLEVERLYRDQPHLEQLYPREELRAGGERAERTFLRLMGISKLFVNDALDGFQVLVDLWRSRGWRRFVERAKADGLGMDELVSEIQSALVSPRQKQEFERQIPERAARLTDDAKRLLARILTPLERTAKADAEHVLPQLGLSMGKESAGTRGRAAASGMEFYDYLPYGPGMDTRMIDWKAYARTGKLVVRRSREAGAEPKQAFNIVVDVAGADDGDLAHLAGVLLYAERHPGEVAVSSCTFVANDAILDRFDRRAMSKLLSERDQLQAMRMLIEKIERLKLAHGLRGPFHWNKNTHFLAALQNEFAVRGLNPRDRLLLVGTRSSDARLKRLRNVIGLSSRPEEKAEKPGVDA